MMERALELRTQNVLVPVAEVPLPMPRAVTMPSAFLAVEKVDDGRGWLMAWADLLGRPLADGFGVSLRQALGLLVEVQGHVVCCHVAYHRRRQARLEVVGIWDVLVQPGGSLRWRWAERRGRGVAYCRHIRFPSRLIQRLARRVLVLGTQVVHPHPVPVN